MSNNIHPMDQLSLSQIKNSSINLRTNNYKSEARDIIQRQRVIKSFLYRSDENEPSIRKPKTLSSVPKGLSITSISSPPFVFAEINEQLPTSNNNRQTVNKKDVDTQSPSLIRRQRPTIEHLSPIQQVSDITNLSNLIPSHFTFRPSRTSRINSLSDRPSFKVEQRLSSPRIRPLNYSKSINENLFKQELSISKFSPPPNFPPVIHRRSESNSIHSRTLASVLRAKSQLTKYAHHHPQPSSPRNLKPKYIQDLYISPRTLYNPPNDEEMNRKHSNIKLIADTWEHPKINYELTSDDDELTSTDENSSTSTCNSQVSVQSSDLSAIDVAIDQSKLQISRLPIKRTCAKRRPYNLVLPPVAEDLDDDRQQTEINEDYSLTFEILNQQETIFEKQLRDFYIQSKVSSFT